MKTSEQFALSGLPVHLLVVAGIAMTVLVMYLAWRDGRLTRVWLTPVLTVLRVVAIVIVLWMLAGPSIVKTVTHTKTKNVAVVVDTSGSMGVSDPTDEPMAARWTQAAAPADATPGFVKLDEASSALAVSSSQLARLSETSSQKNQNVQAVRDAIAQAQASLDTSVARLKDASAGSDDLDRQRAALLDELTRNAVPKVKALADEQRGNARPEDRKEHLESATTMVADLSSRLARLAAASPAAVQQKSAPQSRIEEVASFLDLAQGSWLGEIAKKAHVARYVFDAVASPVAGKGWKNALVGRAPSAPATDLSAALEQVFRDARGEPIDAVLLVTDGGHNTERDPVKTAAAAAAGSPIFILPIGQISPSRDVLLHHVQAPRTAYREAQIVIDGTVDANGYAGQNLTAELVQGDKVLQTQNMAVSSDTFVRKVTFTAKAEQLGKQEYSVRIKPMPEEKVADNNEAKVSVDVVEDKMTILLADALPRWEFRYLKNLFRRDSHVTFEQILTGAAGDESSKSGTIESLPRDLDTWAKYRVVILGDLSPTELSAQQQGLLDKYVGERGGTLILIAGDDAMPAAYANQALGKLLPVTRTKLPPTNQTPFDLYVTAEGMTNAAVQLTEDTAESERLWREISAQVPLYGLSEFCKPKPQGHVLIGASLRQPGNGEQDRSGNLAFLSWQYYGSGRVVYISAPFTYRLRQRHGDKYHYQFWGQLLQWAIARDMGSGSKTVKIVTDKSRYSPGDEVQVTVQLTEQNGATVAGAKPRIVAMQDQQTIAGTDLVEEPAQPGTYRGTLKKLPAGQVTLVPTGSQVEELIKGEGLKEPVKTTVAVDPYDSPELRDTRCNLALLKQIAEATHGAVLPPTGIGAAMSSLRLDPQISETVSRRPLWTRWECLWAFVGCLSIEWTLRKLTGLA